MLRILRNADYPSRLWKNGGGTTRDILVSPPGASLDGFDWRLSLAQVDRDGPFSRFDNVDRTLILLSGAMTLQDPDRRIDDLLGDVGVNQPRLTNPVLPSVSSVISVVNSHRSNSAAMMFRLPSTATRSAIMCPSSSFGSS